MLVRDKGILDLASHPWAHRSPCEDEEADIDSHVVSNGLEKFQGFSLVI